MPLLHTSHANHSWISFTLQFLAYTRSYFFVTLFSLLLFWTWLFLIWLLFGKANVCHWLTTQHWVTGSKISDWGENWVVLWPSQLMLVPTATQNFLAGGTHAFSQGNTFTSWHTDTTLNFIPSQTAQRTWSQKQSPEPESISVIWLKTSFPNLNCFAKICQTANYQVKWSILPRSIGQNLCWQWQSHSRIPLNRTS